MASNSNRMNKIDEELKKEISSIISTELKNPHLTGLVSVSSVKTTPDLKYSKVFVTMINEKSKKENLAVLKQASGFIRSLLAKRINLRNTPEIRFIVDNSIEYGVNMSHYIDEVNKDMAKDLSETEGNDVNE